MSSALPSLGIVTCSRSDFLGLRRTLESLRNASTVLNQLVLVLSEYSADEIQIIKKDFSDLSFEFLLVEPAGIYQAMNTGSGSLRTELVLFLNGGDELVNPVGLINLIRRMGKSNWGYGALQVANENSSLIRLYSFNRYSKTLHRFAAKYVPHPSTVFSVKKFQELGGYNLEYKTAADQDLILKFARDFSPTITDDYISRFYLGGQSSRSNSATINEWRKMSHENFGEFFHSPFMDRVIWGLISAGRYTIKKILSFTWVR